MLSKENIGYNWLKLCSSASIFAFHFDKNGNLRVSRNLCKIFAHRLWSLMIAIYAIYVNLRLYQAMQRDLSEWIPHLANHLFVLMIAIVGSYWNYQFSVRSPHLFAIVFNDISKTLYSPGSNLFFFLSLPPSMWYNCEFGLLFYNVCNRSQLEWVERIPGVPPSSCDYVDPHPNTHSVSLQWRSTCSVYNIFRTATRVSNGRDPAGLCNVWDWIGMLPRLAVLPRMVHHVRILSHDPAGIWRRDGRAQVSNSNFLV